MLKSFFVHDERFTWIWTCQVQDCEIFICHHEVTQGETCHAIVTCGKLLGSITFVSWWISNESPLGGRLPCYDVSKIGVAVSFRVTRWMNWPAITWHLAGATEGSKLICLTNPRLHRWTLLQPSFSSARCKMKSSCIRKSKKKKLRMTSVVVYLLQRTKKVS